MTVCIAALCADQGGNSRRIAVVAADRMVTWGFTEFEHEEPKMSFVSERAAVLGSGDSLRTGKIVRAVRAALPGQATIENIAKSAVENYCKFRDEQVELEQFRSRGLTREKFYQGGSPPLQAQHFFGIDQFVVNFNYNVEMLIAGVDEDGAYIFSVGHPAGSLHDWSPIGFQAIGTGGIQAVKSMIGFSHSSSHTLRETVFAVYASKKRAEAAPGVGKDTDLAIISQKGTKRLTKKSLQDSIKHSKIMLSP